MTTPLYYWKWNDGSGTTVVNSGAGASGNLSIDTVGSGSWSSDGAGGYWLLGGTGSRATLTVPSALAAIFNSTAWGFECVLTTSTSTTDQEVYFSLGPWWRVGSNGLGTIWFAQTGTAIVATTGSWTNSTKYHFFVVFDSNNSTSTDRARVYLNGVRQTATTYNAPSAGSNLGSDTTCYWMASDGGGHPLLSGARMRWTAWFSTIPSDAEIAARSTALLANDDVDPGAAVVAPANTLFSFGGL